jgi:hypothetical protein
MPSFLLALVAAAALATIAAFGLNVFQVTAAQDMTTSAVRLDHQESVNFFGREP